MSEPATQQELPGFVDRSDYIGQMRTALGMPPIEHAIVSPDDVRTLIQATDVLRRLEGIITGQETKEECRKDMRTLQTWALLIARGIGIVPDPNDRAPAGLSRTAVGDVEDRLDAVDDEHGDPDDSDEAIAL